MRKTNSYLELLKIAFLYKSKRIAALCSPSLSSNRSSVKLKRSDDLKYLTRIRCYLIICYIYHIEYLFFHNTLPDPFIHHRIVMKAYLKSSSLLHWHLGAETHPTCQSLILLSNHVCQLASWCPNEICTWVVILTSYCCRDGGWTVWPFSVKI